MTDYIGYAFDVQVWQDKDGFNWAVSQEFTSEEEEKDFVPLGFGIEDSFSEAASAAGDVIREHFKAA